jgi:hypothetical protein
MDAIRIVAEGAGLKTMQQSGGIVCVASKNRLALEDVITGEINSLPVSVRSERISFQFDGSDVRQVIRIALQAVVGEGVELEFDANAGGKVMVYVDDVTCLDLLRAILKVSGLVAEVDASGRMRVRPR